MKNYPPPGLPVFASFSAAVDAGEAGGRKARFFDTNAARAPRMRAVCVVEFAGTYWLDTASFKEAWNDGGLYWSCFRAADALARRYDAYPITATIVGLEPASSDAAKG